MSPSEIVTRLLNIFSMCTLHLHDIYFVTKSLHLLIPLTYLAQPCMCLPSGTTPWFSESLIVSV